MHIPPRQITTAHCSSISIVIIPCTKIWEVLPPPAMMHWKDWDICSIIEGKWVLLFLPLWMHINATLLLNTGTVIPSNTATAFFFSVKGYCEWCCFYFCDMNCVAPPRPPTYSQGIQQYMIWVHFFGATQFHVILCESICYDGWRVTYDAPDARRRLGVGLNQRLNWTNRRREAECACGRRAPLLACYGVAQP